MQVVLRLGRSSYAMFLFNGGGDLPRREANLPRLPLFFIVLVELADQEGNILLACPGNTTGRKCNLERIARVRADAVGGELIHCSNPALLRLLTDENKAV